jgi:hypothetical protein
MCAISGTSGSSGLGSVSNEQIDSSTCVAQVGSACRQCTGQQEVTRVQYYVEHGNLIWQPYVMCSP